MVGGVAVRTKKFQVFQIISTTLVPFNFVMYLEYCIVLFKAPFTNAATQFRHLFFEEGTTVGIIKLIFFGIANSGPGFVGASV
jgi:hypothetical protein